MHLLLRQVLGFFCSSCVTENESSVGIETKLIIMPWATEGPV